MVLFLWYNKFWFLINWFIKGFLLFGYFLGGLLVCLGYLEDEKVIMYYYGYLVGLFLELIRNLYVYGVDNVF